MTGPSRSSAWLGGELFERGDMDAYELGEEAYWAGETENPFSEQDPQRDEWEDGWYDAARIDKKHRDKKKKPRTGVVVEIY